MPRLAAFAIAFTALVCFAAGSAGAAGTATCFAAKGRTLALSPQARLFTHGPALFGCRRGHRPARLATSYDDRYVESTSFSKPKLAGLYAAFVVSHTDISCKAGCPPGYDETKQRLVLVDLRTMKQTSIDEYEDGTWDLTATGAAAWITPDRVVLAVQQGTRSELARGAGIDPASLQASRSRVTWRQDGRVTGVDLP